MDNRHHNKDWEVTIFLVEIEGDETAFRPWYAKKDIEFLVQDQLEKSGKMKHLKFQSVHASSIGGPYLADGDIGEIPF